jgi:cell division protein ZapA
MRVICPHCGAKALITSSNILSNIVKDLYCQCENSVECGASFVATLAFKHMINPPVHTTLEIAQSLVNRLGKEEKEALQRDALR